MIETKSCPCGAQAVGKWGICSQCHDGIVAEAINTPETESFLAGLALEVSHQEGRWSDHDSGKNAFDWFWLIGYLSQKAATAEVNGDMEKAKHHTISTAAALSTWHAHLCAKEKEDSLVAAST